jgi:hypothetical protein
MSKRSKKPSLERRFAVSGAQARASVNRFLLSEVGSQYCAGPPELDVLRQFWQVPILMVVPGLTVGQVGEARVHFETRELLSHTDIGSIHAAADRLRKRRNAAIKTAFLQTRKG